MTFTKEMQAALVADGEKLKQLTGEDHGPVFLVECICCDGSGECPECDGTGLEDGRDGPDHCPLCGGCGACPDCCGSGKSDDA